MPSYVQLALSPSLSGLVGQHETVMLDKHFTTQRSEYGSTAFLSTLSIYWRSSSFSCTLHVRSLGNR